MNISENVQLEIARVRFAMESLSIYRNLLGDGVLTTLHSLLSYLESNDCDLYQAVKLYSSFCSKLMASESPSSLKDYIISKMLMDQNPFTLIAEHETFNCLDPILVTAMENELNALQSIASLSSGIVRAYILEESSLARFHEEVISRLPSWENTGINPIYKSESLKSCHESIREIFYYSTHWGRSLQYLADFHTKWGSGIFSKYQMLVWEHDATKAGALRGVIHPDPVILSDFISYESERSEVVENTLRFIRGLPANNLLLYGDRGTGKSSTVKAIANEYYECGLRIIEVPKMHLVDFSILTQQLAGRNLKFIIFVDDLTFENNEENYTALKAAIEGGLESRPSNVLIYATSNRRHLIKENFSDRAGLLSGNADDEIRSADTMQEKLSLSDRFGIMVVFTSPNKEKYLEIVEGIVKKRGLVVEQDFLHREALKWEMWYNGRSPRTAKQFVDWLQGHLQHN